MKEFSVEVDIQLTCNCFLYIEASDEDDVEEKVADACRDVAKAINDEIQFRLGAIKAKANLLEDINETTFDDHEIQYIEKTGGDEEDDE